MPADESERHVGAIVAQEAALRLQNTIAVLAHRLRATQSPPTNADVRGSMDPPGTGFLPAMHDPAACGADAESTQVRSASGKQQRR